MYSVPGDTTSLVPGFPIRTSSDPRSVGSSPRHIAASHVLHRLPVPRHPPCALKHLQILQKPIIEIAHQRTTTTPPTISHPRKGRKHRERHGCHSLDARNHYPQIKHHTPPPKQGDNTPPDPQTRNSGLVVSKPNSVSDDFPPARAPQKGRPLKTGEFVVHQNQPPLQGRPIQRIAALSEPPPSVGGAQSRGAP